MEKTDVHFFLRKRYYVMICITLGWMVMVMLRTNLSICLVDMTSKKTVIVGNRTNIEEAEFHWTSFEKGVIISSFSWGLLFAPIGGLLATKLGGVKTFGMGICVTGLLTIFSPILLKTNYFVYLIGRFVEGICEGISAASQGIVYVNWVPPNERTFLSNSAYFGFSLGIIVSYPLSGYLIEKFNWEYTFCITGGIAVVWSVLWLITVREAPTDDKFMFESEKNHFPKASTLVSKTKIVYPWKQMLTSKPLWALLNERFVESWSISFFAYCLPLFIKDVYDVNIEELGWLSSIPFYFELFARIPGATFADYLRKNKILSKTTVHRTFILGAQIGGVIFLILTGMANTFSISFIAVSMSRSFFSFASISYAVLPIDIGGHFSSFIFGLAMTAMSIGYVLNPLIIGLMVTNHSTTEWSRYFFALCAINVWASFIFAIFGSGELQTWAVTDEMEDSCKNEAKKSPETHKCSQHLQIRE